MRNASEASAANLFIVRDGVVATPPVTDDILEGVTRKAILELAGVLGIPTEVRSIDRSELYICDEVFLDYPAEGVASPGTWVGETQVPMLVLSGLSKVALVPQLKLGWVVLAGPAGFVEEAGRRLEHIADAFLSVNTPAQLALPDLLRRAEPLRALVRTRVAQGEAALRAWASSAGAGCVVLPRPAGWTAVMLLPPGVPEESFLLRALEEGVEA